jgi:hypothetical protein
VSPDRCADIRAVDLVGLAGCEATASTKSVTPPEISPGNATANRLRKLTGADFGSWFGLPMLIAVLYWPVDSILPSAVPQMNLTA